MARLVGHSSERAISYPLLAADTKPAFTVVEVFVALHLHLYDNAQKDLFIYFARRLSLLGQTHCAYYCFAFAAFCVQILNC